MKREASALLRKATDSLLLAIEHFNRPWDRGRPEAVLVLLDRAHELLLKAVITHKGGRIREPRAKQTIGFDACVRKCASEAGVKCLTEDETLTIRIINKLRDAAQHYVIDLSEQQLYTYTQAGLTLFDKILRNVFDQRLYEHLPQRVLPVSTDPPRDFGSLMTVEFEDIKKLLVPGLRRSFQARAKLRPFAIVEEAIEGSDYQPAESKLRRLTRRMSKGGNWQDIFPGIAGLGLSAEGNGLPVSLRISKFKGEPVVIVPEGTPGATPLAVRRVDELGFYSLTSKDIAGKVGLTMPKMLALVKYLKLQDDPEYFKWFHSGGVHFKRYSPKALERIRKELPNLDMEEVWKHCRPFRKKSAVES